MNNITLFLILMIACGLVLFATKDSNVGFYIAIANTLAILFTYKNKHPKSTGE